MNSTAHYLDLFLYVLAGITAALIAYKAFELHLPGASGQGFDHEGVLEGDVAAYAEGLEAGLVFLAVIAAAAPFLGLAGTVMHTVEALRAISGATLNLSLISGPIATALTSTLAGICCALPAAVAHALLQRRVDVLENRAWRAMEACNAQGKR